MPELNHSNHENITVDLVGEELRLGAIAGEDGADGADGVGVPAGGSTGEVLKKSSNADHDTGWAAEAAAVTEAVAGGAGFVNVGGSPPDDEVTLDLAASRSFHHTMVGNITSLAFSNVPDVDAFSAEWDWVLKINSTGGYMLSGTPTVTWVDGSDWADLDLTASAVNIVTFWRVGATTFAALVWNSAVAMDPYKVCFIDGQEEEVVLFTERETIDATPGNIMKLGDGTITLTKVGTGAITVPTDFDEGDLLSVALTSGMGEVVSVRILRYAR